MTDSAPDRGHLAPLDGLRGIAAVAVAIRHTTNAIPMPAELRRQLFESPLALVLSSQGAVQLFFVLSGWVLAASLARSGARLGEWLPFYVRRVFRIHPAYVLAVLFAWALSVQPLSSHGAVTPWILRFVNEHPSAPQVLQSLAFPSMGAGLLPVGWTLTIEMIYSFALPLLVVAAAFGRGLPLLAAGALLLATPWRVGWYGFDFALGVVAFRERAALGGALARASGAARAAVPFAGALLLAAPVAWFAKEERLGVLANANDAFEVGVMGVGSVLLVIAAVGAPGFARLVGARPFAFLGRISYGIYLIHHTLITFLAPRILSDSAPLASACGLLAAVTGASILLAVPGHRFVELPMIALGSRLARALERAIAPAARTTENPA